MSAYSGTIPALTGGVPLKSQDLAASIIFAAAFAPLLPLAIWRLVKKESRLLVLIRPAVFIQLQIVGYAIRAALSVQDSSLTNQPSLALFIVSQVFLLAGSVLICEPIPSLVVRMIGKKQNGVPHAYERQSRALRLAQLALLAALVIGIVASIKVSPDDSQDTLNTIIQMRIANAALIIGALGLTIIVALSLIGARVLALNTGLLAVQAVLIIIFAAYRLHIALHNPDPLAASTKIIFYVFNTLPQWLCCVLYFVFNLKTLYPEAELQVARQQGLEMNGLYSGNNPPYTPGDQGDKQFV
ncbi:hypothetical protein EMMF5_003902 [Cystobasidiomycetes sp. EMM_F5]